VHRPADDDDLLLPDPAEPTEEVQRAPRSILEWPFGRWETAALAGLYLLPFVISWLVKS
jgi:hypothetical protein